VTPTAPDRDPCAGSPSRSLVLLLAAVLTVILTLLAGPVGAANAVTGKASSTTTAAAHTASAPVGPAAETRVGASTVAVASFVGALADIAAGQRRDNVLPQPGSASATSVAAETGAEDAAGIVYRRTDLAGGKPYIGQAKSDARFLARQAEHARANPEADFEFEVIGRANPGTELDRMEEYYIRQGGGPTNLGNPNGGLSNLRHQMSDSRYGDARGDFGP